MFSLHIKVTLGFVHFVWSLVAQLLLPFLTIDFGGGMVVRNDLCYCFLVMTMHSLQFVKISLSGCSILIC